MTWFEPRETQCKCGCGLDIQPILRHELDALRDRIGAPLYLVSGARCKKYNAKVGGATHSQHIQGVAADILLPGDTDKRRLLLKEAMAGHFTGTGFYKTFIHLDLRPTPAYWVG